MSKSILPKHKKKAKVVLERIMMLIYGEVKLGKSTFLSGFSNMLILATEPGHAAIEGYIEELKSWKHFLKYLKALATEKHNFKMVGIDTIDNLFHMCREHVLKKHGLSHEQDAKWGKGYDLVKKEFRKRMFFLTHVLGLGVIFVSHEKMLTVHGSHKEEDKIQNSLPKAPREIINELVDIIGHVKIESIEDSKGKFRDKHVIVFKPSESEEAGDRFGILPSMMPLDYKKFKKYIKKGNKKRKSHV